MQSCTKCTDKIEESLIAPIKEKTIWQTLRFSQFCSISVALVMCSYATAAHSRCPPTSSEEISELSYMSPLLISGWGASTLDYMAPALEKISSDLGACYFNGAKGGEQTSQIEARWGSAPAKLNFPKDVIPSGGAVEVESSNMLVSAVMKPYAGVVEGVAGNLAVVTKSKASLVFTRMTEGTAVRTSADVQFHPIQSPLYWKGIVIINVGKNNANGKQGELRVRAVITSTNRMVAQAKTAGGRVLVMGHFVNSDEPKVSERRTQIYAINSNYAQRYGHRFLDLQAYLTGPQVWKDTGITPTNEDLELQALGNKPYSLSLGGKDPVHMNVQASSAFLQSEVVKRLRKELDTIRGQNSSKVM